MNAKSKALGPRTTALEVVEGLNLSGRTAIVTGAAGGLGLETVRALASAGAHIVAAVRDGQAAKSVLSAIKGSIEVEPLELDNLDSVRAFATRWGSRPINFLINNAGIMNVPYGLSAQGVENHLSVNHIGHFLLTLLLLPALERGAPSRVVNVSSSAHRLGAMDFSDPNFKQRPYIPMQAYGQSKTANALFTIALDRFAASRGVRSFSLMPGVIQTGLMRYQSEADTDALMERMRHAFKNAEEGAATSVWAAVAPELNGKGGLYLENCQLAEPAQPDVIGKGVSPHAQDPEAAAQLWRWSLGVVGLANDARFQLAS